MNSVASPKALGQSADNQSADNLRSDDALFSAHWKRRFIVAGALAFCVKLWLAWFSPGTQDVRTFHTFAATLLQSDGWSLYRQNIEAGKAFNYLPSMLHFIDGVRFLSEATRWPFGFCLRLPSVLADAGSAVVLWKLLETRGAKDRPISPWAFLLYLCSPIAIGVSGFHGNVDAMMLFFLLLSLLWLQQKRAAWLIGAALGMSLNFKLMPILFAPLFLLFLEQPRRRIEYSICVAATVFVGGLPYFLQNPLTSLQRAFGYSGLYGNWGISHLLQLMSPDMTTLNDGFHRFGKLFLLFAILMYSLWMNQLSRKPERLRQLALLTTLFLVVTPSAGAQYVMWLTPFLIALELSSALLFSTFASVFLALSYYKAWNWFAWQKQISLPAEQAMIASEILCWLMIVVIFVIETRRLLRENRRPQNAAISVV